MDEIWHGVEFWFTSWNLVLLRRFDRNSTRYSLKSLWTKMLYLYKWHSIHVFVNLTLLLVISLLPNILRRMTILVLQSHVVWCLTSWSDVFTQWRCMYPLSVLDSSCSSHCSNRGIVRTPETVGSVVSARQIALASYPLAGPSVPWRRVQKRSIIP